MWSKSANGDDIELSRMMNSSMMDDRLEDPVVINDWDVRQKYLYLKRLVDEKEVTELKLYLEGGEIILAINYKDVQDDLNSILHHVVKVMQRDQDERIIDCLKLLIECSYLKPDLANVYGRTALHDSVLWNCMCSRCNYLYVEVMKILLIGKFNTEAEDINGATPLCYAINNYLEDAAMLLISFNADIHVRWKSESLIHLAIKNLPQVVAKKFDDYISFTKSFDGQINLQLDYRGIMASVKEKEDYEKPSTLNSAESILKKMMETELLYESMGRGNTEIISHPLSQSFLYLKFEAAKDLIYMLRGLIAFIVMIYTVIIFGIYKQNCPIDSIAKTCQVSWWMSVLSLSCIPIITFVLIYYIVKYITQPMDRSTDYNIYMIILILCFSFIFFPNFEAKPEIWHYPFAAISVIYAWVMLVRQVGKIPQWAIYIRMLTVVLIDFIKILLSYVPLLFSFAVAFSIIFPWHKEFSVLPKGFYKTFIMLSGYLDYKGIFYGSDDGLFTYLPYSIPVHGIFAAFVIIFYLVLKSMIVGMAAKDVKRIEEEAETKYQCDLLNELHSLERFSQFKYLQWFSLYLYQLISITTVPQIKNYCIEFNPLDSTDVTFPDKIKQKFLPYMKKGKCANQ